MSLLGLRKIPFGRTCTRSTSLRGWFPPGVISLVSGGVETGALPASHMDIAHINFTGSVAAGRRVQEPAGKSNLKHCILELGGKSPAIVANDAHMPTALTCSSYGFLTNGGQVCAATSRVYISGGRCSLFYRLPKKACSRKLRSGSEIRCPSPRYSALSRIKAKWTGS